MQKESIDYDVVIAGGGAAGLSAAIRLRQLALQHQVPLSVCLLEKGAEIGAHILSGAIIDPRALDELFPDWQDRGAPLHRQAEHQQFHLFYSERGSWRLPEWSLPPQLRQRGNYIASLGLLCRWLGQQAEALAVDIFTGFPAQAILYDGSGAVCGLSTADRGLDRNRQPKSNYQPGIDIHASYTILAEGSRGQLGRQLIERFNLDAGAGTQHYAIGLKELWELEPGRVKPGQIIHGFGWPLDRDNSGGSFLYALDDNLAATGLIVDLNYRNPYLDPFSEFQRMKHHPVYADILRGGKRISYGARTITKGGLNSLPKLSAPGALLVGCNAGTLDVAALRGVHTAMKSGMVAAEQLFDHLQHHGSAGKDLHAYDTAFRQSWAGLQLYRSRNCGAAMHKFGNYLGGAYNFVDQVMLSGHLPFRLQDQTADHACLQSVQQSQRIHYPKPDKLLSFDRLSSVYLSGTNHEFNQPCHLVLKDVSIPVTLNLSCYNGPEQRYCPAGVYEFIETTAGGQLQINAQNCIHCKTCDIKDPTRNIVWITPEGGGPNYLNM